MRFAEVVVEPAVKSVVWPLSRVWSHETIYKGVTVQFSGLVSIKERLKWFNVVTGVVFKCSQVH